MATKLYLRLGRVVATGALAAMQALAIAQTGSALRVNAYVDERRLASEIKRLEPVLLDVFEHRQVPTSDGSVRIVPGNKKLLELWKGDATLTPASGALFESQAQFIPVLMIVEVTNEGSAPADISQAYLRVRESVTDRQPLVRMADCGCGCRGPQPISFFNDGWRSAENAVLEFAFGDRQPLTQAFRADLGTIGSVGYYTDRPLTSLMPQLAALRAKPPRCQAEKVRACFAQLEKAGALGGLTGKVTPSDSGYVTTTISGTLEYQWKHHPTNAIRTERRAFQDSVFLFKFDTGSEAECGAGGPSESGYNPVKLLVDASDYRVPLPYRGALGARQSRRFELALQPERASSHRFEIVVETSDGRVAVSPPVSLLYFMPTKTRSPFRELR